MREVQPCSTRFGIVRPASATSAGRSAATSSWWCRRVDEGHTPGPVEVGRHLGRHRSGIRVAARSTWPGVRVPGAAGDGGDRLPGARAHGLDDQRGPGFPVLLQRLHRRRVDARPDDERRALGGGGVRRHDQCAALGDPIAPRRPGSGRGVGRGRPRRPRGATSRSTLIRWRRRCIDV